MKNHEKRFWQASSGRSTRPRKRSYQTAAARPGDAAKRGCTLARCSNSFYTFGIQLKNHEKRCGQASSGRSTRPRKRSYQTAAAMPGGVAKGGCTRARCSTSGTRDYADSKNNACDARHGARKVQIARCSASTSKNCKISFLSCFVMPVNFPFFKYEYPVRIKNAEHAKDRKDM